MYSVRFTTAFLAVRILMREILKLPLFAAKSRRCQIPAGIALSLYIWMAAAGCNPKERIEFDVPDKILRAKTAGFGELLGIVENYDKIYDLKCTRLKLTLIEGRFESGILDKYRNAPGYVLLRRPDFIRLIIQDPLMHFPQLDLLSTGDDFFLYIKSRREFYTGKNNAKRLVADDLPDSPEITIRPGHLFKAFLPESVDIDSPGTRISLWEETGARAKYYVLSVFKEHARPRIHILRKIWIERSSMTLSRQCTFGEKGQIISDILYSDMIFKDGFALPLRIRIDRPEDGYAMEIQFEGDSWTVNSDIRDDAFILTPPEGARIISLTEKGRDNAS
jgi:hypothetical protein